MSGLRSRGGRSRCNAQIFQEDVPVRGARLDLCYGAQQEVAAPGAGFIDAFEMAASGLGARLGHALPDWYPP